jgi:alpha-beta hydrolase superfamily lysophospholipase
MRFAAHALAAGALLAASPRPALGQITADAGILRFFQAGREVGRETFVRTEESLQTETAIPMLDRSLRYRSTYDAAGGLLEFEARLRSLRGDSLVRTYVATVDGDSLRLSQTEASGSTRSWSAAARPDAVLGGQSLGAYVDLVYRAGGSDTVFHGWSPDLNTITDVRVSFAGDTAVVEVQDLPMKFVVGPDQRVAVIEVAVQRLRAERASGPELPPLEGLERPTPDYSAPPDAPYAALEVRVPVQPDSGEAFELVGTLTVPEGEGSHPVIVTMTGSGGQDRDENLWPLVPTYRPFRDIADRLGRAGIAVLRVDDRGIGASGGSRAAATMLDFADDVRAQLAWLRTRAEIDDDRIGLLGHSEGGVVGPMVAASDPEIAAVVMLAGTAKPGIDVLRDQVTWPIESASDLDPDRKLELEAQALEALENDTTAARLPWMAHFRTYDPLPTARRVRQPVLILQGGLDRQVTAGQADTLAEAMRAAGNEDVTVRIFPDLNHLFLVAPGDGSPVEYAAIEDTGVPARVLDELERWLVARLRPGG